MITNQMFKRKRLALVVVLGIIIMAVTSGCSNKVPNFTLENYPKVDGSTVTIPLSEAVAATLTQNTIAEVQPYIKHNKTHQAYVNLIDKNADLIFVTAPSEEELALAEQKGVTLEIIPIVS